jgi:hypothetical protein
MKTPDRPPQAKASRLGEGELRPDNAKLNAAFGLWREQVQDGLDYQARVRGEWLRRPAPRSK